MAMDPGISEPEFASMYSGLIKLWLVRWKMIYGNQDKATRSQGLQEPDLGATKGDTAILLSLAW